MERVVIALGGNALLRRGAEDTFEEMYRASRAAAEGIADIAAAGWEVVVTHGNGPQVGRILLQQDPSDLRTVAVGDDDLPACGGDIGDPLSGQTRRAIHLVECVLSAAPQQGVAP